MAMVQEMEALDKNEAWNLGDFPTRGNHIGSKWMFKNKCNTKGTMEKYKAWLLEKGYSQVKRIDFGDIFSPISKLTYILFLFSIVASFNLELKQMVVKTTFLHGDLEEQIYMKQW